MRDPNRIDPIIDALREYWHENPDLRLGQIVNNHLWRGGWNSNDPFYAEDGYFQQAFGIGETDA